MESKYWRIVVSTVTDTIVDLHYSGVGELKGYFVWILRSRKTSKDEWIVEPIRVIGPMGVVHVGECQRLEEVTSILLNLRG